MTLPPTPWALRVVASLLALLVTALGVRSLLADITLRRPPPNRPAVVYVQGALPNRPAEPAAQLSPAPPDAPSTQATPSVEAMSPATASSRRAVPSRGAAPAAPHDPAFTAITAPPADAASAPTPDANERRPLDLSKDVMRAAARDSKSTARRMADVSGRALGDEPRSQAESTASSIAKAGKPDCIGPNEGGSLLSVFVIAYGVISERCR